jgi:hypothetical protein
MPEPTKKNPLKTILKVYVVLDLLWAALIATFYSTVVHTIGGAAGAGSAALGVGTVASWIIAFLIALFQGAIFLGVISVFIVVGIALFGGAKKSGN